MAGRTRGWIMHSAGSLLDKRWRPAIRPQPSSSGAGQKDAGGVASGTFARSLASGGDKRKSGKRQGFPAVLGK